MLFVCATEYHASALVAARPKNAGKIVSWKYFVRDTLLGEETRRILSSMEESLIFKQALHQALNDPKLEVWRDHDLEVLLTTLMDADRLMQLYLIPPNTLKGQANPETLLLYRVLQELETLFQKQNAVTFFHALRDAPSLSCDRAVSHKIQLFGFVDWPPLYQRVMPLNPPQPTLVRTGVCVQRCISPEEELSAAIHCFVKKIRVNPNYRAGIVLSDRLLSKKALRFWAKYCLKSEGAIDLPIRFSSRETLGDQVRFAKWTKTLQESLPKEGAQQLLPFLNKLGGQLFLEEETIAKPAIQFVGYLEAAHLPLDGVWMMDASEVNLPFRRTPNVLLPMDLQRKYGVYGGVEAQHQYSQAIVNAIFAGKEGFASFVSPEEELPVQLTGLLQMTELLHGELVCHSHKGGNDLENKDGKGIPFPQNQWLNIKGGATLLKEQAECPFKAFAHYRLKLRAPDEDEALLSPKEKGMVLHAILEAWWGHCQDQRTLLNMKESEPLAWFRQHIHGILKRVYQDVPKEHEKALLALESVRLEGVFLRWLSEEKKRPPFIVLGREVSRLAHLAGLQFKLRLDRLDKLEDGSVVVVDYKTGSVRLNEWFAERTTEPQLPLYAVAEPGVQGLLFASLKPGEMGYQGVVAHEDLAFQKVKPLPNWDASIQNWKQQLESLALEFREGVATVTPIHPRVCEYCDLKALCRIEEIGANKEGQDE